MTDLEYVITALKNLGGEASLTDIYKEYGKLSGVPLTDSKKASIRRTIQSHSSDTKSFKGYNIFYSVEGRYKGTWGLR